MELQCCIWCRVSTGRRQLAPSLRLCLAVTVTVIRAYLGYTSFPASGIVVELHHPTPLKLDMISWLALRMEMWFQGMCHFWVEVFKRQRAICYILFPPVTLMGTSLHGIVSVSLVPDWGNVHMESPVDPGDIRNEPLLLKVLKIWGILYYCSIMLPILTQPNNNKSYSKLATILEKKTNNNKNIAN